MTDMLLLDADLIVLSEKKASKRTNTAVLTGLKLIIIKKLHLVLCTACGTKIIRSVYDLYLTLCASARQTAPVKAKKSAKQPSSSLDCARFLKVDL